MNERGKIAYHRDRKMAEQSTVTPTSRSLSNPVVLNMNAETYEAASANIRIIRQYLRVVENAGEDEKSEERRARLLNLLRSWVVCCFPVNDRSYG